MYENSKVTYRISDEELQSREGCFSDIDGFLETMMGHTLVCINKDAIVRIEPAGGD